MDKALNNRGARMVALLSQLLPGDGAYPAAVKGVELWKASQPIARHPVVYQPKIVVVAQGRKQGYLGNQMYCYDAHNYLVLSSPLPFECETIASAIEPLLGVTVALDPIVLGEMLLEMDDAPPQDGPAPRAIFSTPLTADLSDAVIRLLECLQSPLDARVLGAQTVREIIYRVLQGEQGNTLRALASHNENSTRIARVLRRIHSDYAEQLSVEEMARRAGMSVSVFHHNFKLVTATSPLQYIKHVRLHRARELMIHSGFNAGSAAMRVGYESASQFGREFKRLFGVSPAQDASGLRGRILEEAS